MFNLFNLNLRPMMDEDGGGLGGPAPQDTGETGVVAGGESGAEEVQENETTSTATDVPSQTRQPGNAKFAEMRVNMTAAEKRAEAAERRAAEVEAQHRRDLEVARKYGKDYGVFSDADVSAQYGRDYGIHTVAEFEAALQKEKQDAEYRAKGVDPDVLNKAIASHPDVQAAKIERGNALVKSEMADLADKYQEYKGVLKNIPDILKLPNGEEVMSLAQRGVPLIKAFETANFDDLQAKAKGNGVQETIRNIGSKAHLGTEKSGNQQQGKEVEVSAEKMRVWKAMGYTEAEARKKEAKYLKK